MNQRRRKKQDKRKKRKNKDASAKGYKNLIIKEDELQRWKVKHIQNSSFETGHDLEKIISRICLRIGPPDLIMFSPQFIDAGGLQKEICDLIMIYKDTLMIIQVKHRTLDSAATAEVIQGRAENTVAKLTGQFSTFLKLYESNQIPIQKTLKEIDIQLHKENYPNIILLGVVTYPGIDNFPENKRFEILNGYTEYRSYPLHLFDADDFDKVSLEIDTPNDLIRYLDIRKKFFSEANLGFTHELDLLAFYKMNPDELEKHLLDGVKIALDGNMWNTYIEKFGPQLIDRNTENNISYMYDIIINKVHESIGFSYADMEVNHKNTGSIEDYFKMLNELSGVNRINRRFISQSLKECLFRAESNFREKGMPYAYRLIKDSKSKKGFLLFTAVDGELSRSLRINAFHNLCMSAFYQFELEEIICISTESINTPMRSYDFAAMSGITFEGEELNKVKAMADKLWGSSPTETTIFEFKEKL